MKKICVMGLGYIGLPTAAMFASKGCKVLGVDVNDDVVQKINNGEIHIEEHGLGSLVRQVVSSGNLSASLTPEKADAFIIAVPTPVTKDKKADLSYVEAASLAVAKYVEPGNVIVLESTVPPLTVEEIVIPVLQSEGVDITKVFIGHSPERVIPGNILTELIENNRVVGGINKPSTAAIKDLYEIFVKGQVLETDCTTAEMVKLVENTYRDVNIALANELTVISEKLGLNVWEAIDLANYHPRVNIHKPGPGVGGHCIAIDPYFIIERAKEEARLISLSRETNSAMPQKVVDKVRANVRKGQKIAVLGVAYKGNVDDIRESPSLTIINLLMENGYKVSAYDPYVKDFYPGKEEVYENTLDSADCILLLTDHSMFAEIDAGEVIKHVNRRFIIDTRNILNDTWKNNGFNVQILGLGTRSEEKDIAIEAS